MYDGLWFGKEFVFMAYKYAWSSPILHYSFLPSERSSLIRKDLIQMQDKGYDFHGFVTDGGSGVCKAINDTFLQPIHQVCLQHVYRKAIKGIGNKPKEDCVKDLRALADLVWSVKTKQDFTYWSNQLLNWSIDNKRYLLEKRRDTKGRWWYTHRSAKRAIAILLNARFNSFEFTKYQSLPKTTNQIESIFSVIRRRFLTHRGLKKERWRSFLSWYIFFWNKNKLSDSF